MKRLGRIYIDAYKGLSRESWMLALVMLMNRAGSMVLPFLGVYMIDHLNFSIAQSGFVLSFFGFGSVLGSFIGGRITDKMGAFKVQAFSLLVSVPMFCLIPLFSTVAGLASIIFAQSIISELFRPANSVAITQYARPQNLTRAFSLNRMAVNLGFSIGPALGGILSAISYNFLFYSNAIAAFVAGIAFIIFFRKRQIRNHPKPQIKERSSVELATKSPYRDRKFYIFNIFCLLFSVCFFQLLSTLPLFYKEEVGLSQKMIGVLLGFSGLVIVGLEMFLVHVAEKKLSIVQTMVIGTAFCAASFGMLAFEPLIAILFISIGLLSIGEIFVLPFMSTITALRSDEKNKGAYMGMNGMAVALSFIISPLLGSKIATDFGFNTLWIGTFIVLVLTCIGFHYSIKLLFKDKAAVIKKADSLVAKPAPVLENQL